MIIRVRISTRHHVGEGITKLSQKEMEDVEKNWEGSIHHSLAELWLLFADDTQVLVT